MLLQLKAPKPTHNTVLQNISAILLSLTIDTDILCIILVNSRSRDLTYGKL